MKTTENQRFKAVREKLLLTQAELSKSLEVSNSTIAKAEALAELNNKLLNSVTLTNTNRFMRYKMFILFWLRKNKLNAKKEAAIYCRITIGGVRATEFTTNIFTTIENWESKRQRIKNDSIKQSQLETIRQKLCAIHLDLELKDIPVTAAMVKAIYLGPKHLNNHITVTQLFNDFIASEQKVKPQTIPQYKRRIVPFFHFLSEAKSKELQIFEITHQLADNLKDWLLITKNYNPNYAIKIVQLVRMLFNYAIKKQYISQNPFALIQIKSKQNSIISLSKNEIITIMQHTFASLRLQQVADLFLLQCFTGMAYVDLMNFEKKHIQGDFIYINRQKTESESLVPVLPDTSKLLTKYNYKLPKISNQKYNAYLKEIAEIVGIEKQLTTHVGRKTCGNILLNAGASIEVVSRILGHRDTKITQHIYAKVNEYRIKKEISNLDILK